MSASNYELYGTRRSFDNVKVDSISNERGLCRLVQLHGNTVLRVYEGGMVQISNCGWVTPTTNSAINTGLSQVPWAKGLRVGSRKGITLVYLPNGVVRPLVNGEMFRQVDLEVQAYLG